MLTDTEARFLLAWHVRKDVPRNADGTVYKVPNQGRILDSLIRKGMLESGRWELTVSPEFRLAVSYYSGKASQELFSIIFVLVVIVMAGSNPAMLD